MFVSHLALHDFRSYSETSFDLNSGPTAFIGSNGQGKTNLVEAIDYVSHLESHRVASDAPLVRAGSSQAVVRVDVQRQERSARLEIEITPGKANRARINGSPLPRTRDLLGVLRTVMFAPDDLVIVKGDPSERRKFLDTLLVLQKPRLSGVRADYDRVLRQRNTLLKSARNNRQVDLSTLSVWDEKLAELGGELIASRLRLLDDLGVHLVEAYVRVAADAAPGRQKIGGEYRPSIMVDPSVRDQHEFAEALLRAMTERRRDELDRGVTLVGPHRDDVHLFIGDLPAKGYASHGESWSFALALRLAAFALLRHDDQDDPVLILDDVFAELDQGRREQLATLVADAEQVIVTAAVADDVPKTLQGDRFYVADGEVKHA